MRFDFKYIFCLLLIINFSCEKSDDEVICNNYFSVIGDNFQENLFIEEIDTLIYKENRCDTARYFLDIDLDGSNDIKFSSYYCYGLTFFDNHFFVETLNNNARIQISDITNSPEVLSRNDTIQWNSKMKSGKFDLLNCYREQIPETGKKLEECTGIWQNIDEKYIGITMEKDSEVYYVWIKAGLLGEYALAIYEIAVLEGCQNNLN